VRNRRTHEALPKAPLRAVLRAHIRPVHRTFQGALIAAGIGAALTATVAGCGSNKPADYQAGYSFAQQHTTQFYESGDLPTIFCNIRVPLDYGGREGAKTEWIAGCVAATRKL
jgi:hypothetical protein